MVKVHKMAAPVSFWILTFLLCTLTHSEVIESNAPKESSPAIDSKNEAPYSAVGKEDSDVTVEPPETSQSSTPAPEKSYDCRPYAYCRGTLFPYEVTVEGDGWSRTILCQQGVDASQHCCLPAVKHYICYNITVKDEGRLSLGDTQKHETDFSTLCGEMLKTLNHTIGRYAFVTKTQGGADVVYRDDAWGRLSTKDSYYMEDLSCEYDYVKEEDDEKEKEEDVDVTTATPEEEEEEEEEEEDEEEDEREKKEREKEEAEGGGDGGSEGGGRKAEAEEEEEGEKEKEEEEEEEEEPPQKKKPKKKKKGRRG